AVTATASARPVAGQGWQVNTGAVLSGGFAAGGTVEFDLVGPLGVVSQTVLDSEDGYYYLDGSIHYLVSAPVPSPGAYTWQVHYLGDPLNSGAVPMTASATRRTSDPAVTATASATPVAGRGWQVNAEAVLSGGLAPGGAVEFDLVGPLGVV